MAAVLLPAASLSRKLRGASLIVLAAVLSGALAADVRFSRDISEDRRNSFSPAMERTLDRLDKPLRITVHLSPEDSRFLDLERNILGKLRRSVPRLEISMGAGRDYGWIMYEYDGKADRSTSNSEEEILSIIFKLADKTAAPAAASDYGGYPFTRDAGKSGIWFYLILPALLVLGAVLSRRESAL